jgi:RNA polymerase sigma-70 factor (ECF subfamily)
MLPGTASEAGVSDWSVGGTEVVDLAAERRSQRPSRAYSCPEDVFAHEYQRLVEVLTIAAGSREVAADAVQEAFARLVRGWKRLATYEDPAGWVRRVALNLIRDHHRSLWRQARLRLKIEEQHRVPQGTPTTDDRLRARVEALPFKQRTALGLYYMEHMTTREVADVMKVSEGSVKQHLFRARQALRVALKEASDD